MTAAWIAESLLLSFLLCISSVSPADQINITAVIGENKILPCRAENGSIKHVEWNRTDIEKEYVLRYRNDAVDRGDQHPSFKHRVFFQDREMKDGDVSLVLINVRMNDAGTYEARVVYNRTNSEKKLICTVHLDVAPPPGSFPSWAKALLVIGVLVITIILGLILILIGFLFCGCCRRIHRWRLSESELIRRLQGRTLSPQEVKEEKDKKRMEELFSQVAELLRRLEELNHSLQVLSDKQVEVKPGEESDLPQSKTNEAGEQDQTNISGTTMNEHPPRTEDTDGHSRGR